MSIYRKYITSVYILIEVYIIHNKNLIVLMNVYIYKSRKSRKVHVKMTFRADKLCVM